MILALVYPILLGVDRIEAASFLRSNGTFQYFTGLPVAVGFGIRTPELAADIMEQGIMVTGGGALLAGINRRLNHETGMPIKIAHDPLFSVVIGWIFVTLEKVGRPDQEVAG